MLKKNTLLANSILKNQISKNQIYYFSREIKSGQKINSILVGDFILRERTFNQQDLINFSNVSGDKSPIHLDPQFAATTIFKKPIVYGMLTGSMFTEVLGNTFPGVVYLSQTLNFIAPVFIDEKVQAKLEITEIINNKKIKIRTTVTKIQENKIAVEGEALVYYKELQQINAQKN